MKDKTLEAHATERGVIKEFHQGMKLFEQGCDCPKGDSPERMGWLAMQEMDRAKKRWLLQCKERFTK